MDILRFSLGHDFYFDTFQKKKVVSWGLLTMTPMATVITFSSAIDGSHWTLALELQRCMPLWIPHAIVGGFGLGCFFCWRLQGSSNLDHGSSRVNILWRLLSWKGKKSFDCFRQIFVKINEESSKLSKPESPTLEARLRRTIHIAPPFTFRSPNFCSLPGYPTRCDPMWSPSAVASVKASEKETVIGPVIGMALGGLWRDYYCCLFFIPIFMGIYRNLYGGFI